MIGGKICLRYRFSLGEHPPRVASSATSLSHIDTGSGNSACSNFLEVTCLAKQFGLCWHLATSLGQTMWGSSAGHFSLRWFRFVSHADVAGGEVTSRSGSPARAPSPTDRWSLASSDPCIPLVVFPANPRQHMPNVWGMAVGRLHSFRENSFADVGEKQKGKRKKWLDRRLTNPNVKWIARNHPAPLRLRRRVQTLR
jgi:hypothetical protein